MTNNITSSGKVLDLIFTAKNTAICYALTIALLFLVSWIGTIFAMHEAAFGLVVNTVTYISIGICGFRAARHTGNRGLISGMLAGFFYVILLYFIGSIAFGEFSFDSSSALAACISVLCGAIGGLVGINMRRKKRR